MQKTRPNGDGRSAVVTVDGRSQKKTTNIPAVPLLSLTGSMKKYAASLSEDSDTSGDLLVSSHTQLSTKQCSRSIRSTGLNTTAVNKVLPLSAQRTYFMSSPGSCTNTARCFMTARRQTLIINIACLI